MTRKNIFTLFSFFSDRTVFVSVPKPGMKFTVKLWADSANSKKAYRTHVFIDGIWDHASYTLKDPHSNIIEYLLRQCGQMMHQRLMLKKIVIVDLEAYQ